MGFEVPQQLQALGIANLEMLPQQTQSGEIDIGAYEQNRLPLLASQDDLVRRAHTINVRWTVTDDEVARVHHAQIDVKRRPIGSRTGSPGFRSFLSGGIAPTIPPLGALFAFESVFIKASNLGFEPRIKDRYSQALEKLTYSVSPTKLLFVSPRGHKIHRSRKVDT